MERRYHHGSLREALLDAAERILASDGMGGLTLRAVAREAGVTHGSPKHHFRDFAALLSGVAARGFNQLASAMLDEAAKSDGTDGARRRGLGVAYVAFALKNSSLYLLMFRSDQLDADNVELSVARAAAFDLLAGPEAGEHAIVQAAREWAQVHGLAMLVIDGQLKGLQVRTGLTEKELARAVLVG